MASTTTQTFGGDKKVGQSILGPWEKKAVARTVRFVPSWLQTHHLTMMTVAWSALMVLFGWLAQDDPLWLFAMSAMVVAQYVTDAFDGAVGRLRQTGLVKWGFFMDHFLDFLFAGSIIIAFSFMAPAGMGWAFMGLLLTSLAMMAVSFLSFAATNQFRIAFFGVGPTEIRIGYLAINTVVYFAGTGIFSWSVPALLAGHDVALALVVHGVQKTLWRLDMDARDEMAPPAVPVLVPK